MAIDIDLLTEAELIDLNRRIVERLRVLHPLRAHATLLTFSIGDRVTFATNEGRIVVGTLVRYHRKTVGVLTDAGQPVECLAALASSAGTTRYYPHS